MSRMLRLVAALSALCVSGCVFSIAPIATEENRVSDPNIAGTWELVEKPNVGVASPPGLSEKKVATLKRTPNAKGAYWFEVEAGKGTFLIEQFRLGDDLYLEISADETHNQLFSIPLYQLYRISINGDELRVSACNMQKLASLAAKEKLRHTHREMDIILTGPAEEVREFYRKHGDALFDEKSGAMYRRKETASQSDRSSSPPEIEGCRADDRPANCTRSHRLRQVSLREGNEM